MLSLLTLKYVATMITITIIFTISKNLKPFKRLFSETRYTVKVRARNDIGNSPFSASTSFTTLPDGLAIPSERRLVISGNPANLVVRRTIDYSVEITGGQTRLGPQAVSFVDVLIIGGVGLTKISGGIVPPVVANFVVPIGPVPNSFLPAINTL